MDLELGCADVGEGTWNMERDDRRGCVASIRRAVELGLRHIDTAEMYGAGKVEQIVGEALEPIRDQAFLASKVLPANASYDGTIAACEASLRRLRTDRLDLYMLHWPGHHPLEETVRAFEALVEQGKILRWGVSNFDVDELEQVHRIAGPGAIRCNQVLYHLEERSIEHRVIPWCFEHAVPVVAYSPFGAGHFPRAKRGRAVLAEVAEAHAASERQVALRFLGRLAGVYTIPKASRVEHVEDNAGALGLRLSDDEIARIDAAFPVGPLRGLPVL